MCTQPHDLKFMTPLSIQFLGPFERPVSCIKIQGLSILYHYLEKKDLINLTQKTEIEKTMMDCLNGNESKYVRMFDDGQVALFNKEYEEGILVCEYLDRKPSNYDCSMCFDYAKHYTEESAWLMRSDDVKRLFGRKMDELKAMKGAQDSEVEEAKAEARKISKLFKEKEAEVRNRSHKPYQTRPLPFTFSFGIF